MERAEVIIVGGGIVGLATAYDLTRRFPGKRVLVLEKESAVARHQTGRNSGVLHSGVYYQPGSLKARNCLEGKRILQEFCDRQGIPYALCGKVIVAVEEAELPRLKAIYQRGQANGVRCTLVGPERLKELEPAVRGIRAIHVPEAGIIDYTQVCEGLVRCLQESGGEVITNSRVKAIASNASKVRLKTSQGGIFEAGHVVNCTGLQSDRVARLSGARPEARIVPFRGEYYELKPEAHHLCRGLIYPVPDPSFPFLGVHFTRMIAGGVECGPNAVLAFAREGYRMTDVNLRDLFESLTYPGFLRLARKYWRVGLEEMWRSISKRAFVRALQRLVPEITARDLNPAPAGIRAQAVNRQGSLVYDFEIREAARVLNVCNAPSPAATACLNIGRLIVDRLAARFE